MLVCVGGVGWGGGCGGLCVCVRVYALRTVSRDNILRFKYTFIIIIIIICEEMYTAEAGY